MPAQRMKDVVEYVKNCHHQLSERYHRLMAETDKDRIRALLTYLERHEAHLEESLQQLEDDASQRILQTQFPAPPEPRLIEDIKKVQLEPEMTVDDVVTIALQLDDRIIAIYRHMVEHAATDDARAVFQDLLDMETREELDVARKAAILSPDV